MPIQGTAETQHTHSQGFQYVSRNHRVTVLSAHEKTLPVFFCVHNPPTISLCLMPWLCGSCYSSHLKPGMIGQKGTKDYKNECFFRIVQTEGCPPSWFIFLSKLKSPLHAWFLELRIWKEAYFLFLRLLHVLFGVRGDVGTKLTLWKVCEKRP